MDRKLVAILSILFFWTSPADSQQFRLMRINEDHGSFPMDGALPGLIERSDSISICQIQEWDENRNDPSVLLRSIKCLKDSKDVPSFIEFHLEKVEWKTKRLLREYLYIGQPVVVFFREKEMIICFGRFWLHGVGSNTSKIDRGVWMQSHPHLEIRTCFYGPIELLIEKLPRLLRGETVELPIRLLLPDSNSSRFSNTIDDRYSWPLTHLGRTARVQIQFGKDAPRDEISHRSKHFLGWGSTDRSRIQEWIDPLENPNWIERCFALDELACHRKDAKEALGSLDRCLYDPCPQVRIFAARAIGQIAGCDDLVLLTLATGIFDNDFGIRSSAYISLGQLAQDATALIPDLIQWIKREKNTNLQVTILSLLAEIGCQGNPDQRRMVLQTFGELLSPKLKPTDFKAEEEVVKRLVLFGEECKILFPILEQILRTSHADPIVEDVLKVFSRFEMDALPILVSIVKDPSAQNRGNILYAWIFFDTITSEMKQLARLALESSDRITMWQAIGFLTSHDLRGSQSLIRRTLKTILKNPKTDWDTWRAERDLEDLDRLPNGRSILDQNQAMKDLLLQANINGITIANEKDRELLFKVLSGSRKPDEVALNRFWRMVVQAKGEDQVDLIDLLWDLFPPKEFGILRYDRQSKMLTFMDRWLRDSQFENKAGILFFVEKKGSQTIPLLKSVEACLTNPNRSIRNRAIESLRAMGRNAYPAIPTLEPFLEDPSVRIQIETIKTLLRLQPGHPKATQILIERIELQEHWNLLEDLEPRDISGKAMKSILQKGLRHPDHSVYRHVKDLFKAIEAEESQNPARNARD